MSDHSSKVKKSQSAKAGKNAIVVGRDYTNSKSVTLWIPMFFIGVTVLGGLAWALNVGSIRNSGNPQQLPQPNQTEETQSP